MKKGSWTDGLCSVLISIFSLMMFAWFALYMVLTEWVIAYRDEIEQLQSLNAGHIFLTSMVSVALSSVLTLIIYMKWSRKRRKIP